MNTGMRYFFDLPVYRIPRGRYYQEREAFLSKNSSSNDDSAIREHLQRVYGGPWEYNEIIGYIKLHFLGTQVRGEYFAIRRQRLVRTRRKVLEFQTWKIAPEISVNEESSGTILQSIYTYIDACGREIPRRHIDTEMFDALAPFVNWKAFYDA